jgi:hypothetical protein
MPSESKAQKRLMLAIEHNERFAKKVGIPQSVGAHYNQADKAEGTKYASLPERVSHADKP